MLVMCERWNGDGTDCHILTPSSSDHYSSTSSSFCWAAQPGSWGLKPSVCRWLSLRHLVPKCDWNSNCDCNSNWTLPASNSNCHWTKPSEAPGYIIVWRKPASCERRICTEFNPSTGQGDIFDRIHLFLPLIYTGASLNWQLGRGSICYPYSLCKFEFQFHYYLHSWTNTLWKSINPFPSSFQLNSTSTVLQKG